MNNLAMMQQLLQSQKNSPDMAQMMNPAMMNPAMLYQNQINLYQALQDPSTVAMLIQQQQALHQQLQVKQN